ncbi:MAG TPA: citrate synthase [Bacillota bacterium]|nr:citrate synthase [Bacillota bacterium]
MNIKDKQIPNIHHLSIHTLLDGAKETYMLDPEAFKGERIKKGLRNSDGTGVVAGVTGIGLVHGYVVDEGEKCPVDGKLYYRGYDVEDIVNYYSSHDKFGYEECSYLLLMGELPTSAELEHYDEVLNYYRQLPQGFVEDVVMRAPNESIMSKIAQSVLALSAYDPSPDDISFENVLVQSAQLVARLPIIAASAYAVKRHVFQNKSLTLHNPKQGLSTSENFLRVVRSDKSFTRDEAKLLDLCLILHAEHGGGNNSTFTCRSLTSTGTDTYSAIAGALGALKGPRHGGANIKVVEMLDDIKANVRDTHDEDELRDYLLKILDKKANDNSGLIYGMGHAVYTKSDPRSVILKRFASEMVTNSEFAEDFKLLNTIERISPALLVQKTSIPREDFVSSSIDMYSGIIFRMLRIPEDMFTPLFAIARISGWCAHRMEELITSHKIIRPAYKYAGDIRNYISPDERFKCE